jgi:hypothetical protein
MREEGVIEPEREPTDEEIRRYDRKRKDKKVSNAEWESSTDADARITKMKDGRTHLAYKAEHVVDLRSDLVLAAEISPADHADTATLADGGGASTCGRPAATRRSTKWRRTRAITRPTRSRCVTSWKCGATSRSRAAGTRRGGRTSRTSTGGRSSTTAGG